MDRFYQTHGFLQTLYLCWIADPMGLLHCLLIESQEALFDLFDIHSHYFDNTTKVLSNETLRNRQASNV